jgi:hypothetical protein
MRNIFLKGRDLAVKAELTEALQWLNNFSAAPSHVTDALGLVTTSDDDADLPAKKLSMVKSHIPFCHFNTVLTLGCPTDVEESCFSAIDDFFADSDKHWVLVNDYSEPSPQNLVEQLLARGYERSEEWDRIVLQVDGDDDTNNKATVWNTLAKGCELVTTENSVEWSNFVVGCYHMPPIIGDWLQALVGRPGWIHAFKRSDGEDKAIAMARSLWMNDMDGWAWLGIDAPVPGVMAPCYQDDQEVTAALLAASAKLGAHSFVSDVEKVSESKDSESYRLWAELGFDVVYRRELYSKGTKANSRADS